MAVFKRYNTLDRHDLHDAMRQLDTSMDTAGISEVGDIAQNFDRMGMGR